jgi:hypothetical protein
LKEKREETGKDVRAGKGKGVSPEDTLNITSRPQIQNNVKSSEIPPRLPFAKGGEGDTRIVKGNSKTII